MIALSDAINVSDAMKIFTTVKPPIEITSSFISSGIGFTLYFLLRKHERVKHFVSQGIEKLGYPDRYRKTPYDNLELAELEKIQNRLDGNYRIIITVYGVLLAFVVSDKISYALSSWSFIVWCGWILAVIIKTGFITSKMSDIIEIKRPIEEIRRKIFSAKEFFNYTLILLVLATAFLPTFFLSEQPSVEKIKSLPWDTSTSLISGAFGIMAVCLFFYGVPLQMYQLEIAGGKLYLYMMIGTIIILAFIAHNSDSPITPVFVSILGNKFYMPSVFYIAIFVGNIFGFGMITPYLRGTLALFRKSKS